ncbi:MAG: lipoate--protein ligase [Firmicutes bacterium]|nr:lipoate--protein ligase [Bacillota bacterium]
MANYVFFHQTDDGWQNLAVDEFLLRNVGEDDIILHLYVNAACVVIGKHQNPWRECNLTAMEADGVKLVRRISGGGAVFHDLGNVNFSFIAHKKKYHVPRQMDVIIRTVQALGIPAEFSGRNDILVQGKKFSGNAFCEVREGRQHHGTLLVNTDLSRLLKYLSVSDKKIRAKGVASVQARVCNLADFAPGLSVDNVKQALCATFAEEYGDYQILELSEEALKEIQGLYSKHSSWQWRLGRTPRFDMLLEERFSWGEVQLHLTVKDGVINEAKVYSDSLDVYLPPLIAQAVKGAPLSPPELRSRVQSAAGARLELMEVADWLGSQSL